MRPSSPVIAEYKPPFKGMDTRSVTATDAPDLLLNVDVSDRGVYKARPGVKPFANAARFIAPDPAVSDLRCQGLFTYMLEDELFVFGIFSSVDLGKKVYLIVFAEGGDARAWYRLTGPFDPDQSPQPTNIGGSSVEPFSEGYFPKSQYNFVAAGRFVYFCNGIGALWEVEILKPTNQAVGTSNNQGGNFNVRSNVFEEGNLPLVMSYLLSDLKPTTFSYFFDQIVISGFKRTQGCELSSVIPAQSEKAHLNSPPEETINLERNKVNIDPSCILVSEPALWRSFPVTDPGGFYWVFNEDVIATVGVGTNLVVFGERNIYKIINHGSNTPRRVRIAELSLVGSRAFCYFKDYLFFVATDGCYMTDGNTINKISYEMDGLWFSRTRPSITRANEKKLQADNVGYPFFVNPNAMDRAICINDKRKQQIMLSLPANDSPKNNMVWVFSYADMLEGAGPGKWTIWCSGAQPQYTVTSLTPGASFGPAYPSKPTAPAFSAVKQRLLNWDNMTEYTYKGKQRVFFSAGPNDDASGNSKPDQIFELGGNTDLVTAGVYDFGGTETVPEVKGEAFPVLIGLGRVGRVDSDGRVICTDIAVRRKQLGLNVEDNSNASSLLATVRSEGEGLKLFDATETDVEFTDTIINSQQGFSENTNSVLNKLVLGESPAGSSAPLLSSEYVEAYARVNAPDEEGRAAYVDLYCINTTEPHRLEISEIRVLGNVKGGSQREQS
jgi:hypothetical protein